MRSRPKLLDKESMKEKVGSYKVNMNNKPLANMTIQRSGKNPN
jgi:hypothetical protein